MRLTLPFVSSSPCPHIIINFSTTTPHIINFSTTSPHITINFSTTAPHIPINFSTTAPQHMLLTSQMSCPITFPNLALTHFTFNFALTIFLVIPSLLLLMFIPVVPIHFPNFFLILLCPTFPISQAYIASSIFSPILLKHSPASTFPTLFFLNFFYSLFILSMLLGFQMLCPSQFLNIMPTNFAIHFLTFRIWNFIFHILNIYYYYSFRYRWYEG